MVYEGFLVSVTWTEPRLGLKLSDALHSTASNASDRLFSGSDQSTHRWSKNFNVYSLTHIFFPWLKKSGIYAAKKK